MTTWNKAEVYDVICSLIEKQGYVRKKQVMESCAIVLQDPLTFKKLKRIPLGEKTANRRLRDLARLKFIISKKVGKTWRWLPTVPVEEIRKFVKSCGQLPQNSSSY